MSKHSHSNSNIEKQLLPIAGLVILVLFLLLPYILYQSRKKQTFQDMSKENKHDYF
jgi:hypothetical protein